MANLLVTKGRSIAAAAEKVFEGTNVNITSDRCLDLGTPLGTQTYVNEFMTGKVEQWSNELHFLYSATCCLCSSDLQQMALLVYQLSAITLENINQISPVDQHPMKTICSTSKTGRLLTSKDI